MKKNSTSQISAGRRRRPRGSILFLTLLFLVLINLFAVAFWKLVPMEMHSARKQMLETEAYFASDAGVVDTLAFLEDATSRGNLDVLVNAEGEINADGHRVLHRTGEINGWDWHCDVIPGPETFGHKGFTTANPLRTYKLEAMATRPGISGDSHHYRKVTAWVKQRSFGDDNWNCSEYDNNNPLFLFMNSFKLGGTYRTNGPALLRIRSSDNFWNNDEAAIGGKLIFAEGRSYPGIGYVDGVHYSTGGGSASSPDWGGQASVPFHTSGTNEGEPMDDRYEKLTALGRAGVVNAERLELPESTDNVAVGVWGDTTPTGALPDSELFFDSTSKVRATINDALSPGEARTGIWIDGTVNQIEFRLSNGATPGSSGADTANQIIKIWQGTGNNDYIEIIHVTDSAYNIPGTANVVGDNVLTGNLQPTANDGKGYTVIKNGNTNDYRIYNGQTNGAIYATGDILGVRGTVKGRRTVAVSTDTLDNTAKDNEIRINGELLYAHTVRGEAPANGGVDMLGLLGYAVRMEHDPAGAAPSSTNPQLGKMWPTRASRNENNPYYFYTSIFAGRRDDPKMGVSNMTTIGGGFGSSKADDDDFGHGHMVVFGSITEGIRQHKGTGTVAGNGYEFFMDNNLKRVQPPFYPSAPNYNILTWQEESVFSY
ncbi:MAG: hypothetical protein WC314_14430 [Vulcanimicrobiota bacterium]